MPHMARARGEHGFTLIEILVVVMIIGILAAIAIPSFLSQSSKSRDAAAKVMGRTAQQAIETYYTDAKSYNTDAATLRGIEPALNNAVNLTVSGTIDSYTISNDSTANPTGTFTVKRDSAGKITRTCSPAGKGGCSAAGTW